VSAVIKALLDRYFRAWNNGDRNAVDETCSPDFVFHVAGMPDMVGLEAHHGYIAAWQTAMPDVHIAMDRLIVEGEHYAARYIMTGTHTGSSPAIPAPPMGKQISVSALEIGRVVDGRFVEGFLYPDQLGLMQQVGALPMA
jgi:predicted ester cyclase